MWGFFRSVISVLPYYVSVLIRDVCYLYLAYSFEKSYKHKVNTLQIVATSLFVLKENFSIGKFDGLLCSASLGVLLAP